MIDLFETVTQVCSSKLRSELFCGVIIAFYVIIHVELCFLISILVPVSVHRVIKNEHKWYYLNNYIISIKDMVIGALTIFHSIYSHIFKPFRFVSFYFMIFRSALNGFFCLMLVLLLFVSVFKKFSIWFYMTFPDSVTSYFKKQSIEKLCISCNDCCEQVFGFSFNFD